MSVEGLADVVSISAPLCPCPSAEGCPECPGKKDGPSFGFLARGDDLYRCRVFAGVAFPVNSRQAVHAADPNDYTLVGRPRPCPGTAPLKVEQRGDARAKAQAVLARARCIKRHPGLTWYQLADHWGFRIHAAPSVQQLLVLGFIRKERVKHTNRFYPA